MQVGLTLENKIENIIAPSLAQLGYDLVRVIYAGIDGRNVLQIMIEKDDGSQVNIDDCEKASRQISAVLDVEGDFLDKYTLEVSSPGIDRPLTRLKDFDTYKGLEARLELKDKINEQRKFRGRIVGTDGDDILIYANLVSLNKEEKAEEIRINFNNLKSAKLVLNDELLAIHKNNNT